MNHLFLITARSWIIAIALISVEAVPLTVRSQSMAAPPRLLGEVIGYGVLILPDQTVAHFYAQGEVGKQVLMRIQSRDGGQTWSDSERLFDLPAESQWAGRAGQSMVDREGNLHLFLLNLTPGRKATWHTMQPAKQRSWTQLKEIYPHGALNPPIQLRSGRIVVSVAYFTRDPAWDNPSPRAEIITCYSDDSGKSWHRSLSTLVVFSPEKFPGVGSGGHEPVLVELPDGRVWMLIRTQTGWLYESFSPDGSKWSEPRATSFYSSDSPGALARLPSGEIVLFWNSCEIPSPVDGRWIYTGRDALHGAISRDGGKTWQGYREVYLDPFRDENPPAHGDRGTSYSNAVVTANGKVLLVAGQGKGRTRLFQIDPAWLYATHHADDFSRGLDGWSVFKAYGPVKGYRRNRVRGAERIPHPTRAGAWVLHVRRPDDRSGDGAAWNFPAGRNGRVTLRMLLKKGFGGGLINFTDRFIYPNDADLSKLVFSLPVSADGAIGNARLEYDRWYTVDFAWHVESRPPQGGWPGECRVNVDGQGVAVLPQLNRAKTGLSYLRLHSTAPVTDTAGLMIEQVSADVAP